MVSSETTSGEYQQSCVRSYILVSEENIGHTNKEPVMLYYRRKSLGIAIDMNGIVTNSYQWHFTRITSSGQVGISFRLITDSADIEFLLWQLS